MSQPQGTEVTPTGTATVTEPVTPEGTGTPEVPVTNELWEPILKVIPPALHEAVVPTLKNWDSGFQKLLEKKMADYEPYKDFIGQVDPEELTTAVNIARLLESDPEKLYEALSQSLGKTPTSPTAPVAPTAPATPAAEIDPDDPIAQKLLAIEQQNQLLMQQFQQNQQQAIDQQEQQRLFTYLEGVQKAYPAADMEYVVAKVALGQDGMSVAKAYTERLEALVADKLKPQEEAPTVLGGTGGVPSNKVDLKGLNDEQVKQLVAQTLVQNRQQT